MRPGKGSGDAAGPARAWARPRARRRGRTARRRRWPPCPSAPGACPCSAGRAAASVRDGDHGPDRGHAELGGLLDGELHAVALQRREGERDAQRRLRARGATGPRMRASTSLARDRSSVASNSAPAPSNTRTAAPARSRSTSRAWWAAVLGEDDRARPGAASGTWKRGRLTQARPPAARAAAHSPSVGGLERAHGRVGGATPATSARSRPDEHERAPSGASSGHDLVAPLDEQGRRSGWRSTRSKAPGAEGHGQPSPSRAAASTRLSAACRRAEATASGSISTPRRRRGAQARGGDGQDAGAGAHVEPRARAVARRPARLQRAPGRGGCSRGCRCRRRGPGSTTIGCRRRAERVPAVPARHDLERAGAEGAEALAEARHPVHVGHGRRRSTRPPRRRGQGRAQPPGQAAPVGEVGQEQHRAAPAGGGPRCRPCRAPRARPWPASSSSAARHSNASLDRHASRGSSRPRPPGARARLRQPARP